jgi:hypothetical protein
MPPVGVSVFVCASSPFKVLKHSTDLYEHLYEYYAVVGTSQFVHLVSYSE